MNPRELATELQRLKQLAKSLLATIEALQGRLEHPDSSRTLPPPARPTTRLRRVPGKTPSVQLPAVREDEPPSTRPGSGRGGTYRHVTPSKKR